MPNTSVPATAEGLLKFDRAAIMQTAWRQYRISFIRVWIKQPFNRSDFAFCLSRAWQQAREARMTARERRSASIRKQIEALQYKSLRYDIGTIRTRLETELTAIS